METVKEDWDKLKPVPSPLVAIKEKYGALVVDYTKQQMNNSLQNFSMGPEEPVKSQDRDPDKVAEETPEAVQAEKTPEAVQTEKNGAPVKTSEETNNLGEFPDLGTPRARVEKIKVSKWVRVKPSKVRSVKASPAGELHKGPVSVTDDKSDQESEQSKVHQEPGQSESVEACEQPEETVTEQTEMEFYIYQDPVVDYHKEKKKQKKMRQRFTKQREAICGYLEALALLASYAESEGFYIQETGIVGSFPDPCTGIPGGGGAGDLPPTQSGRGAKLLNLAKGKRDSEASNIHPAMNCPAPSEYSGPSISTNRPECGDLAACSAEELEEMFIERELYGLKNWSNQCFMTSALFSLLSNEQFRKIVIDNRRGPICGKLLNLMNTLNMPNTLDSLAVTILPDYIPGHQFDSAEFHLQLMGKIELELGEEARRSFQNSFKTSTFIGKRCTECDYFRDDSYSTYLLKIQMPDPETSEILQLKELLSEDKTYEEEICPRCQDVKKSTIHEIRKTYKTAPNTLLVHVDRKIGGKNPVKSRQKVTFTNQTEVYRGETSYILHSYIEHIGTAKGGHYTCGTKTAFGGKYHHFNDQEKNNISEIEERDGQTRSTQATILMFLKTLYTPTPQKPVTTDDNEVTPGKVVTLDSSESEGEQDDKREVVDNLIQQLDSTEDRAPDDDEFQPVLKSPIPKGEEIQTVEILSDEEIAPAPFFKRKSLMERVSTVKSRLQFSPLKTLMSPKVSTPEKSSATSSSCGVTSSPYKSPHKKRALQIAKEYEEAQDREEAERHRLLNSVEFFPGSKKDVIFVGPEQSDIAKWAKDATEEVYVVVGEEKVVWIRVKKDCMATVDNLQYYLITHCSTVFYTPMMFHAGRKLKPEEKLTSMKGTCIILTNALTDAIRLHPGKIWVCESCEDKSGLFYRGNMKKEEWKKVHKKPTCSLMFKNLLESKTMFGKVMERKEYKTIHACPLKSRENFLQEQKLSLNSPVEPAVKKKAPKRKIEAPGRNVEKSKEDCPSAEPRDDSTVSKTREDSPSSSSERR